MYLFSIIRILSRAAEMAQQLSTGCFSKDPEFNSQQLHCGLQPSIIGYDALICHAEHSYIKHK